jgi:hypothetical protein
MVLFRLAVVFCGDSDWDVYQKFSIAGKQQGIEF